MTYLLKLQKTNLLLLALFALLTGCNLESDRRIKLATKPVDVLMQDRVSTIQVAAARKKSIAIFQFLNHTSMQSLDWLQSGIVEMLGTELSQSRQLNLQPTSRIPEALQELGYTGRFPIDTTVIQSIARNVGAEVFISGGYYLENDSLRIELDLRDVHSGALLQKVTEKGGGLENVFTMVNKLSKSLRGQLQINISNNNTEINKNLADVSTRSVEAFKHYAQGMELDNKLYLDQAVVEFQKAIQIDTTFASAYHQLGIIQSNNGNAREAAQLLNKAVQFSESLPPKERLQILASQCMITGNLYQAIEIYKQLTNMFPEDDDAHLNLGNYFFMQNNSWEKAIEEYEITIALNPKNKLAYNHLGYACAATGKLDYAWHYLEKYIELAPDEPNPYDSYGEVLQKQGELDEAIDQYKTALDKNPDFFPAIIHIVNAYLDKGKTGKARSIAKKALKNAKTEITQFQAKYLLAKTFYADGDIQKSVQILEKIYKEHPHRINTLAVLMTLDKNSVKNKQRLENWFKDTPNITDSLQINYNNLFAIVSLCLQNECCLNQAELYLNHFLQSKTDPFLVQTAVAYKQIIYYLGYSADNSVATMPIDQPASNIFRETTNIPWNYYWKYYFKALEKAYQQKEFLSQDIQRIIDYSKQEGNLHFEINCSYVLAHLHLLENNGQAFADLYKFTGTPPENDWRLFGPFTITKGLHEQFWPEQNPAIDLLNEQKDLCAVPDNIKAIADGFIDLHQVTGAGINSSVYGLLTVNVPSARTVQIRIGSTGPVKVWLNDHLVLTRNENGPALLDQIITPVNLNAGINYILVKCNNRINEPGFYFRVTDENGYGYPDISFSPAVQTFANSDN